MFWDKFVQGFGGCPRPCPTHTPSRATTTPAEKYILAETHKPRNTPAEKYMHTTREIHTGREIYNCSRHLCPASSPIETGWSCFSRLSAKTSGRYAGPCYLPGACSGPLLIPSKTRYTHTHTHISHSMLLASKRDSYIHRSALGMGRAPSASRGAAS